MINENVIFIGKRSLSRTVALAFALIVPVVQAAEQNAPEPETAQERIHEPLRAKRTRTAMLLNKPYTPISNGYDQAEIPEIEMFVGESRVFPAPGVGRIAVGNGKVMSAAALDNKQVIVFANEVGTSSLFIWNEDGRYQRVKINIVPGDTSRYAREIAAFLSSIPNARASVIGDKVIVEGDRLSDDDLAKIDALAKRYPQIVNFTNRLGWEKMVMMDVKVVEFPRNELKEIGLKWTSAGGAALGAIWSPGRRGDVPYIFGVPSNTNPPITGVAGGNSSDGVPLPGGLNVLSAINMGLNAQLNLLAQEGRASILAQPQLSARNGSKASFLAGGEFPYTVTTLAGPTVQFKQYGVKLDITPQVDRHGVVRATLDSEVSSIDASVSTPAGPALRTRKTSTEFNVKAGDTIVLAGLLQRDTDTSIDKVPLLGDIPVLGALFRSRRFQNNETELVVFVTPTIIDSHTPELNERVEQARSQLEQSAKPAWLPTPRPSGLGGAADSLTAPADKPVQGTQAIEPADKKAVAPAEAQAVDVAVKALVPAGLNPLAPVANSQLRQTRLSGLVLRSRPSSQAEALLQLGRGAVVQAWDTDIKTKQAWSRVSIGALDGWVQSAGLVPLTNPPKVPADSGVLARADQQGRPVASGDQQAGALTPIAADPSNPRQRFRVALNKLALRVTPDVNAPVLRQLDAGTRVEALPQPQRGRWIAVETHGQRGWVALQWLIPEAGGQYAAR